MFGLNAFGRVGAVVRSAFAAAADPDAVIKALFANSEQGAWFDYSDLTTMFQDRAGTTPVTADGQTVGLILDKSKGLVLGPELVTNGDFSDGTTGWSAYSGATSISNVANALRVTIVSGTATACTTSPMTTVIGRTYKGTCKKVATTGTLFKFYVGSSFGGGGDYVSTNDASTGDFEFIFVATSTTTYFSLEVSGAVGSYGDFDNISVKELAGNHAIAQNDAARPLKTSASAADWIDYDAVDDVLNTTFPSSLGSSCTVCRANVGAAPTILTAQTIGTSYADSTDNAGLIIINRALTAQETTDVTAWLLAKGATS